ncbi:MAG: sensor histidine kinase, partial [bacterium]
LHEDHAGNLWIGSTVLNKFDRAQERFIHCYNEAGKRLGLMPAGVTCIAEDRAGNLWVGSNGLKKYDWRTGKVSCYQPQAGNSKSIGAAEVTTIYEDRAGRLWVGTFKGLELFEAESETFVHYRHEPNNPNSLGNSYIKTIFEDRDGKLWIGTTDGLNKFDPATKTFTRYHEKDGLPNTFIYGILGDDHGNLWLSTNRGLSKFNPATGKFRNYDLKDGLQSYEFNTGAYHRSKRTGEMFFGGINGVNIFHPDSVRDSDYLAPIILTDFKKFDLPVKLAEEISENEEVKLAYEEDVFSFEFASLDFTHPEKNQYAYKLEGFDQDWVYCGTRRFARYTNLDPGAYTFRVKGTNHDGVWNEQGTSIKITIVPPFWMTWWFRALAGIFVLSVVAGTVSYVSTFRTRKKLEEYERQQALENERKRISKDMHDELGANLTKIAILSDLAQKDFAEPGKLQPQLQKISEIARITIDNMSEIIWAINPQHNTLDGLAAYLRKYAANYLEMTPVRYRLDFPETVPGHPLSAEFRRHIFMVVKEALHNVVKHAQATELEMKLGAFDHTLEIAIQDNGKGFCTETLSGTKVANGVEPVSGCGNGMPNMAKRIAEVGGRLDIQSRPQHGTTIKIYAKIT